MPSTPRETFRTHSQESGIGHHVSEYRDKEAESSHVHKFKSNFSHFRLKFSDVSGRVVRRITLSANGMARMFEGGHTK